MRAGVGAGDQEIVLKGPATKSHSFLSIRSPARTNLRTVQKVTVKTNSRSGLPVLEVPLSS